MHLPLICFTETQLLPSSGLSGIPIKYQTIGNDNEIDMFNSLAVRYHKNEFTCLEQERFDPIL